MRKNATSKGAMNALAMLSQVQDYFVTQLSQLCQTQKLPDQFTAVQWLRDNGTHGGGLRFEAPKNSLFNQASVNVSQIQYEDIPDKNFLSATALSTIIHPNNPHIASIHIHISWTELRSGKSYWRLMADLNPCIKNESDTSYFNTTLKAASGDYFEQAKQQGDEYFYIPALQKHRGVSHFYLEGFNPEGVEGDHFASTFVSAVIDCYITLFRDNLKASTSISCGHKKAQLDYHTLYLYQVLTLDKGTTAGLLVHDQNDVGTLGSLPAFINRQLLTQWIAHTPAPRDQLVKALVDVFDIYYGNEDVNDDGNDDGEVAAEVTTKAKTSIAQVMRAHYKKYPL